jgi:hypothetical protein
VAEPFEPVILTVPRGAFALSAMRVVAGWVASCNDLALDELDDLDLALETLLAGEPAVGERLSLSIWVMDRTVQVLLEGLQSQALHANLEASDSFRPSAEWPLDIRLFLGALVDSYELVGCGAETFGISMRKRIA